MTAAASSIEHTLLILEVGRQRRSKPLSPDEADMRLLLALETFPAGADGVRSVGLEELARASGVAYATARRSRDRLIADGLITCEAGNGRGNRTKWRFASALKVLSQAAQVSRSERCSPSQQPRGTGTGRRSKPASRHPTEPVTRKCRVCHLPLDPDPAVAASGIHPCCEPDDAPNPFAPRRVIRPEVAKRGLALARAALEGKQA